MGKRAEPSVASVLNRVEEWLRRDELIGDRMRQGRLYPMVTDPQDDERGHVHFSVYFTIPDWAEFRVYPSHKVDPYVDRGTKPNEEIATNDGRELYWTINVEVKYTKQPLVVAIDEFATLSDAVLYLESVYS